jgi:hypothetical protein
VIVGNVTSGSVIGGRGGTVTVADGTVVEGNVVGRSELVVVGASGVEVAELEGEVDGGAVVVTGANGSTTADSNSGVDTKTAEAMDSTTPTTPNTSLTAPHSLHQMIPAGSIPAARNAISSLPTLASRISFRFSRAAFFFSKRFISLVCRSATMV